MTREARLAARLNHPNAVAVHDLVVEDGRPHVIMEYVPGRTLADEIAGGPLHAERVAAIGCRIVLDSGAARRGRSSGGCA